MSRFSTPTLTNLSHNDGNPTGIRTRNATVKAALLALTLGLGSLGCDMSGEDGPAPEDEFVGTWTYTSGTRTTSCGAGAAQTEVLTGDPPTILMRGISSPLVMIDGSCSFALDITGNTASARPGQQCATTANGASITFRLDSYTFTVDGIVADESGSLTVSATGPGGIVNCTRSQSGKMMKIAR
jgi:hypothetical protein